jgi:sphingomyelin phosphodiesterase 2
VDTHPNGNIPPGTTPLDAIVKYGVTADSPLNTYSAGKNLSSQFLGKRLDYILYRQPHRLNPKSPVIRASECRVVMINKVPGYDFSFSDHFGVAATLRIDASDEESASGWHIPNFPDPVSMVLSSELSSASTATVIQALTSCYRFSRQRAQRELTIFGLCLLLLFAITVGTAWLPHSWIDPVFVLLTIFVAWLATTMLYEGFVYGHWECNALMNVIEELEVYRKGLEIQSEHDSGGY